MKGNLIAVGLLAGTSALLTGCGASAKKVDLAAETPPPARVESAPDVNLVKVEDAQKYPAVAAIAYAEAPSLNATGQVSADVSRTVPVISLASGRVVEIFARLGDTVRKGQVLLKVQSADLTSAFSDYRKAIADEMLARSQYERAKDLKERGAIPAKDLDVAENVENDAKVTLQAARERLQVLGADPEHPSNLIDIKAPVSGVVTEQNVTAASGVKTLDNSPNLFTISDLSRVWVLCDVYENDLAQVRIGEMAEVRLNAYPERVFRGRIGDIGRVLDPNLRTAKVRVEVANPGLMRLGMFVTATFHGLKTVTHAAVPATAVLHLHDRDWVYIPQGGKSFRRAGVTGGRMLPEGMQEITDGLAPGQEVVKNALILQNTVEQ